MRIRDGDGESGNEDQGWAAMTRKEEQGGERGSGRRSEDQGGMRIRDEDQEWGSGMGIEDQEWGSGIWDES